MSIPILARRLRSASGTPTSGFTLVELMIVIAIVAVLAAVAFPAYDGQIRKSRRADAITRIAQIQQAQERWRASNTTYTNALAAAPPAGLGLPATTADGYYTLSIANTNTATSYQALAQATGAQTKDTGCAFMRATAASGTITLESGPTSAYSNGPAANNRCWNR